MTAADNRRTEAASLGDAPIAIVCGGGSLPFAVADSALRRGRKVLLFALRGSAEPARVAAYPHYWMRAAQFGRFRRLARAAGCREVVLIGSVVRPTLAGLWPDYGLIPLLPRLIRIFSGGDDHLLSGVAGIFERNGFKMVGAHEIAPDIGMPEGPLGRVVPMERDHADIARALALLRATGPFDVGQAVVVADGRVLAIEAAEGTDEMLAKLAELRAGGRIRVPMGAGVLVKAPKPGQDHRFDLPSIGPQTIERAAGAGLAGIAVIAGGTIIAEPQAVAAAADRRNIFVVGIGAGDIRE